MGHTWQLDDGTTVHSGGVVEGASELAEYLRHLIALRPFVTVGLLPDGRAELDPKNDFLLHAFVRGCSVSGRPGRGFTFTTDYEPRLEDAPADVQELVRGLDAEPYVPGRIY